MAVATSAMDAINVVPKLTRSRYPAALYTHNPVRRVRRETRQARGRRREQAAASERGNGLRDPQQHHRLQVNGELNSVLGPSRRLGRNTETDVTAFCR